MGSTPYLTLPSPYVSDLLNPQPPGLRQQIPSQVNQQGHFVMMMMQWL